MKTNFTLTLVMFFCLLTHANNITVSNISLENLNESEYWTQVEFDLSWENSWRLSAGPSNWDAAWVFIKYRANNGEWIHARLAETNNVAATGSIVDVSSDGVGAFVYRDADGSGNLNLQDMRLRWNYGPTVDANDVLEVQVFAIEMVYIPEGPFYVGGTDGNEPNKFYGLSPTTSYQITSENAIEVGQRLGLNYVSDNTRSGDGLGPVPADFPKGYNSFYIMKYEVSESQWLGFFNSLTIPQKINRDITDSNGKNTDDDFRGNTISWEFESSTGISFAPDRSMAYTSAGDALAYLDWCGLRPFTELEYEKACRGPILPKAGEFAWGTDVIHNIRYNLINVGASNELITNPAQNGGNATWSGTSVSDFKPLRNGIFAASAINKTREETGGSYYGVMELTGNVGEICVTLGNPRGRQFTGLHGNGLISASGNGGALFWPLDNKNGFCYRGGSYTVFTGGSSLYVSGRYTVINFRDYREPFVGIRAARTAE